MDPVSNQPFSHDYAKYVYQTPDVWVINHGLPPSKPFEVKAPEKSKKTKKDMEKEKKQNAKKESTWWARHLLG